MKKHEVSNEEPKFLAPETCPRCGSTDIEEGGSKEFGDEERRSFCCNVCDEVFWHQWERVEKMPYAIEIDDVRYDLPEDPNSGALRLYARGLRLLKTSEAGLAATAEAMDGLIGQIHKFMQEAEPVVRSGPQQPAAATEKSDEPAVVRQKQSLAGLLTDMDPGAVADVLADYIGRQDEGDQDTIARAVVDACTQGVRDDIGEGYFNTDRDKC